MLSEAKMEVQADRILRSLRGNNKREGGGGRGRACHEQTRPAEGWRPKDMARDLVKRNCSACDGRRGGRVWRWGHGNSGKARWSRPRHFGTPGKAWLGKLQWGRVVGHLGRNSRLGLGDNELSHPRSGLRIKLSGLPCAGPSKPQSVIMKQELPDRQAIPRRICQSRPPHDALVQPFQPFLIGHHRPPLIQYFT